MINSSAASRAAVALPGLSATRTPPASDRQAMRVQGPLALRFTGSATEYFRIWIVNVCLTIVTLGIYSAWAKVRKKRYLYSHTVLDGTPFQYLGQPLPILKGRLVAALLFGIWYAATNFITALLPIVLILAFFLAPWVMVRGVAFNARYSAYRNLTFHFEGNYKSAFKMLYGWGVVVLITFGIAFSWWQQKLKQYFVQHTSYGDVPAQFSATGRQFFKIYFLAGLMVSGSVAAGVFLVQSLSSAFGLSKASIPLAMTAVVYVAYVGMYAYTQARITNLSWSHIELGPLRFRAQLSARRLLWLYISNAIAILVSAGLLIPWATIRMLQYRTSQFSITADGYLDTFHGSHSSTVQAAGAEVGEFFDFDMSL